MPYLHCGSYFCVNSSKEYNPTNSKKKTSPPNLTDLTRLLPGPHDIMSSLPGLTALILPPPGTAPGQRQDAEKEGCRCRNEPVLGGLGGIGEQYTA